jgi:hypothetical protein
MQLLRHFIYARGFLLHGYCRLSTPGLRGLYFASGSLIASSRDSIRRHGRIERMEICA